MCSSDLMKDGATVDAFGELQVRPDGTPWADITLRRCNFSPYTGSGPFDVGAYFSTHEADDFSDFGLRSEERRVGKECRSRW